MPFLQPLEVVHETKLDQALMKDKQRIHILQGFVYLSWIALLGKKIKKLLQDANVRAAFNFYTQGQDGTLGKISRYESAVALPLLRCAERHLQRGALEHSRVDLASHAIPHLYLALTPGDVATPLAQLC